MRIAAKTVRFVLIVSLSLLGGALSAAAYTLYSLGTSLTFSAWMPMIVGTLITNFLARWWSFRHPPRFSQEWEDRQAENEEF